MGVHKAGSKEGAAEIDDLHVRVSDGRGGLLGSHPGDGIAVHHHGGGKGISGRIDGPVAVHGDLAVFCSAVVAGWHAWLVHALCSLSVGNSQSVKGGARPPWSKQQRRGGPDRWPPGRSVPLGGRVGGSWP